MSTDLDRDDELGTQLRTLQRWQPDAATDRAWARVEHKRRRRMAVAALPIAAVLVAVVVAAVVVATNGSNSRVQVVTPTPVEPPRAFSVLTTATSDAEFVLAPAGPYTAGQQITAQFPEARSPDFYNNRPTICYTWADGELCDPALIYDGVDGRSDGTTVTWDVTLPGWVHTPAGFESCAVITCRVVLPADGNEGAVGSAPLTIDAGPMPVEPVRIVEARADGTLVVDIDGITPDASWTAWAKGKPDERLKEFPAGGDGLCVWAQRMSCDGFALRTPLPFDGQPHRIEIPTNRKLFTNDGWVDCVEYTCALSLSRYINVYENLGESVGSSAEIFAVVPYRLPADTPRMPEPTLTVDRPGPYAVGDTVTVTVHDLPTVYDIERLQLAQCDNDDVNTGLGCGYWDGVWEQVDAATLRRETRISPCRNPTGCYLALAPTLKGYPAVAKTERFAVTS